MKNLGGFFWGRDVCAFYVTPVVLNLEQFETEKDGSKFCQDLEYSTLGITLNTLFYVASP